MSEMPKENEEQMEASSEESEDDSMDEGEEGNNEEDETPKTYLPGQPLKDDEQLVCDQSAYIMLHQAQTGAPCLSFNIIEDNLGNNRETFPLSTYMVAGTQASSAHLNKLQSFDRNQSFGADTEVEEDPPFLCPPTDTYKDYCAFTYIKKIT